MEFRIGAAHGRMELNDQMAEVWTAFETSISLPFRYSRWKAWAYPGGVDGVAGADLVVEGHPESRGQEFSRIVVDADRFFALDERRRFLTLLHESLHLASFLDALRSTVAVKHRLGRQYNAASTLTGAELPPDDFDRQKVTLSFLLADHVLEYEAEMSLRENYAEYAAERTGYCVEMRRAAIAEQRWLRPLEPLRPYALLLEWCRLDLGLTLTETDEKLNEEVARMLREVEAELAEYPAARERIERLKAKLRCSALAQNRGASAAKIYTDVFDEVLSVEGR
jgi:hypothetical protein